MATSVGVWVRRAVVGPRKMLLGVVVVALVAVLGLTASGRLDALIDDPEEPSVAWLLEHQQLLRPLDATAPSSDDQRPNVVLVLTDDMRVSDLPYMPQTRRLLARRGATFDRSISPHPLCCPARAELLSAQYAQNNGVYTNRPPYGAYSAFDPSQTIAVRMQRTGYLTAFTGKHLNRYGSFQGQPAPLDPGWDIWKPIVSGVYTYDAARFYGSPPDPGSYVTTEITDRAVDAIKTFAGPGDPFYLQVDHLAPHTRGSDGGDTPPLPEPQYANSFAGERNPSKAQPNYLEPNLTDKPSNLQHASKDLGARDLQKLFLARIRSLQSVDDGVAKMVKTLKESGEYSNTYFVFTSDNGYAIGEHQYVGKNRLTAEILRVPLLVAGPGIKPGTHNKDIVTTVDTAATILQITGSLPDDLSEIDGASFSPNGFSGRLWRRATLVQVAKPARRDKKLARIWDMRGVVTNRYTYAVRPGNREIVVLFDHKVDPWELRNLAGKARYATVERQLARQARQLAKCRGVIACNPLAVRRTGSGDVRLEQRQPRRGTRSTLPRPGRRGQGTR